LGRTRMGPLSSAKHVMPTDCYCQGGNVFVVVCLLVCLSVCLSATLRKNFRTDLHKIFNEGWQWANEQITKFWWQSGSPSEDRGCFRDLSLLGDTENGIKRLRCETLQRTACTSRYRQSNYDVITSPALGGGRLCIVPVLLVYFILGL